MTVDPNASDATRAGGLSGRWRGLLIASLALNLFLAGIIGVWAMRPYFHKPPPPISMTERMAERLPEADKTVLRQAFAKRQSEIDRLFQETRQSQQTARAALRADPFDAATYDAAAERDRVARAALQTVIQSAMREAAVGMSAEGRGRLMSRRRPPG